MFAVRRALSQPERLAQVLDELVARGQLDPADLEMGGPLDFLVREGHATSLPDAAYRFCRDEPGTHVILSGTGSLDHLKANIASFDRPPLSQDVRDHLATIFRHVDSVTGQ
jgi:aryl-alcohol dehydrogenase-like predicted oxidoreductase